MAVLKIKDAEGNVQEVLALKGEKGDKGDPYNFIVFDPIETPTQYQITATKEAGGYSLYANDGNGTACIINAPAYDKTAYENSKNTSRPVSCNALTEILANIELAVIVSELPETGTPNKIFMVANSQTEGTNVFDEYLWINDAWEYIGSVQAQIDLSDYVKKTDYASTTGGAGVVKISANNGIYINAAGILQIFPAKKTHIDAKDTYKPIVPSMLDYAVHSVIKDFVTEMAAATTFEELKTACENYINSIS